MKKLKYLKDLTEIRFGINARTVTNADIPCLQGKDFDKYGQLNEDDLYMVGNTKVRDKDCIKINEVLFAGKGNRNYAVVWKGQRENAVASSTFFILTVKDNNIIPEYLEWYLNSYKAQNYFKNNVIGATIFSISKKILEALQVELPEKAEQEKIVKINELWKKEKSILQQLINKKELLINKFLSKKYIGNYDKTNISRRN